MTPPLVLHSSRARLALQLATPVLLLALGTAGLTRGGSPATAVVLALGVIAAVVVLLDMPVRSEFDADGVTRVCPLRRHHLPWSEVVAVERLGPAVPRRGEDASSPPSSNRGLTARTGPRRVHLLTDRRESNAEWDALRQLLDERATQLRATRPPLDAAPAGRGPRALHNRDR